MSARHTAMGRSNINSCESLRLAYAMADVAARLHEFSEIDRFARTGPGEAWMQGPCRAAPATMRTAQLRPRGDYFQR